MQRVNSTIADEVELNLFGAGKHGYQGGNATTGRKATQVPAAVMNTTQEELANFLEDPWGGTVVLDPNNNKQLIEKFKNYQTPVQFDNTKKLATTEFVKRQGLQSAGFFALSGAISLNASHIGATVMNTSSAAAVWTLPAANSVPAGARVEFINQRANELKIVPAGADKIYRQTVNPGNDLKMYLGEAYTLLSDGNASWFCTGFPAIAQTANVAKTTTQQIPGQGGTKITYDQVDNNYRGLWNPATQRFEINVSGQYRISGSGFMQSLGANVSFFHMARINNAIMFRGTEVVGSGGNATLPFARVMNLAAGDYVEVIAQMNNGGAGNLTYGADSGTNYCTLEFLGG